MEAGGQIKEAAQQCVKGFIQCLDIPTLKENEWAENRLADMNLWVSGTGACARGRASLQSRLASRPETCDVIANLLRLLHIVIGECRTQSQTPESFDSHPDEESPVHSQEEGQGRAFSPWSDDSSSDCQSDDAHDTKIVPVTPLREKMYNIESIQDQLAWIAVAIRRSGKRSRLQKADLRFEASKHQELEGHLVGMLLTLSGCWPQERDASKLSEVQLRLIRCNLKRRNRFLYAQQHSRGLDADSIRRENRTAAPKKVEPAQGEMISGKSDSRPSNDRSKHANSTVVTGTSASTVSEDFTLPQSDRAAPAASSIMSATIISLDYPRPPRFKDDAHLFRCPCCCEALPAEMANRNRWRKHIADDLSPYTCILNHCDQPDVLFNTKEAWRQHVLKDHSSLTYWICFACGDGSQFNDVNAFMQHTKSFHAATIPLGQIPVLCDLSKKKTPEGIQRCPLCNWPEEEGVEVEKDVLLNHIAKEIHSFSLRALPWADDNGQESDQRISDSSEKVYEWLIQSDMLKDPGKERPSREKKAWHSEYFHQNPYFASISEASSSTELDSNESREEELEKLRNAEETIVHESREAVELASQVQNSEGDTRPDGYSTMLGPEDYTIGWVCAITTEYVASQALLDEKHETPTYFPFSDKYYYTLGRIGKHNVVISVLPIGEYGPTSAALVSEYMIGSFPNIRIIIMVGIASGVPSQNHDVRLGDVVVGFLEDGRSGVLVYDSNNTTQTQALKPTGTLGPLPTILRRAVSGLRVTYQRKPHQLHKMVYETFKKKPRLRKKYQRPDLDSDRLYRSEIIHPMGDGSTCNTSCGEDLSRLIPRTPRTKDDDNPAIHYGLIASFNRLIRDATIRDKLAAQHDVLCFEREAAGFWNFPCLVIRGICDYADTHKNKEWQGYSAMVAAAYAKELLHRIPSLEGEGEAEISEVSMSNMLHGMPSQASMVPQTITPSQAFPTSPMTPPPLSYSNAFDPKESG